MSSILDRFTDKMSRLPPRWGWALAYAMSLFIIAGWALLGYCAADGVFSERAARWWAFAGGLAGASRVYRDWRETK
jgi:hypothetical protein